MVIELRKMTTDEYNQFYQWSFNNHVKELMEEEHMSLEDAHSETTEELSQMLPNGIETVNNILVTIKRMEDQVPVGFMWTIHEEFEHVKQSFLCDFVIFENYRGKGYATESLSAMEKEAKEAGCKESVLFVKNSNLIALKLYKKSGYQLLRHINYGTYMKKQL